MRRIRIIPLLLVQRRGLVKSVRFKNHQYVGDPINVMRIFNEKEVDELIILDISATPENRGPDIPRIREFAGEAFMPFAYGGGIKSVEEIGQILANGAEKVVLNTTVLDSPDCITEAAKRFGSQCIVVAIDVKRSILGKGVVFRDAGRKKLNLRPAKFAKRVEELGAGEIILTCIERDGTFRGFDLPMIEEVSGAVRIPIVACGGAGKLEDFRQAVESGASAVAAGSFFVFQGRHRAVLISYSTQAELKQAVFSKV